MTTNSLTKSANCGNGFFKKYSKEFFIGLIFMFMYTPTLLWMWDRWFSRDSYYSHGILIPIVTIYLIWQNRSELAKIKRKKSNFGIPIIVLGIFIHILSSLFRVYFTSGYSMLVVLVGIVLYFYGSKMLKKISFPIFFLIFMMPIPLVLITNISFKMKILAAEIATNTLNSMGILAAREGSLIKMRNAYVIVDDVCSGLRSLISLTALGSIFAYWMKAPMYKRILLFLSTIPIAIITNVARVIFLSSVADIWGAQYAVGFLHDFSGFLVFALAFILLFMMGRLLE